MNGGKNGGGPRLFADNFLRRVILDYFGINCYGEPYAEAKARAYLLAAPKRDLAFWEELASPCVVIEFERLRELVRSGKVPSREAFGFKGKRNGAGGRKGGKKANRAGA